MKLIIAGSREGFEIADVFVAMEESGFKDRVTEVVSGTARGVDRLPKAINSSGSSAHYFGNTVLEPTFFHGNKYVCYFKPFSSARNNQFHSPSLSGCCSTNGQRFVCFLNFDCPQFEEASSVGVRNPLLSFSSTTCENKHSIPQ